MCIRDSCQQWDLRKSRQSLLKVKCRIQYRANLHSFVQLSPYIGVSVYDDALHLKPHGFDLFVTVKHIVRSSVFLLQIEERFLQNYHRS